ncbi:MULTISPECIES: mannitol dehydrogenase family protein [unclassified Roseitalea]|uniref:mannitol dehydrogenase family protein n=1 Tax=unclassified Roseitalea TaxID=2639107 RepID=UPI00273F316F|nr:MULTISPECIES: mannitol dehydrogenase family protein [unclassified Roseitalea]
MTDRPRLSNATVDRASADVRRPAHDRARVTPGIVHLGIGNFHRAHQAVYVDDILAADPGWGIVGASLRRPDMAEALTPQDGLYTLGVREGDDTCARIIGSVLEVIHAGADPAALIERLADPRIRIVSLTVTEKGYCHDPATANLDADNRAVRADLENPDAPHSAPGLLVAAIRMRRARGIAPFTVLSCDNLPENGHVTKRVLAQFAALSDAALSDWIAGNVAFPSTMVDRIVPATTDADRAAMAALTGLDDAWPVVTEPFSQWVIEDGFGGPRPDFGAVGAQIVADVAPFEAMKLRMLNGAHSAIAYLGQLAGHQTVAEAVGDAAIADFVQAMWAEEIVPTLDVPDTDLGAYARALADRFANAALRHRTAQIAMDGSQKVPQRLLATIADRRKAGASHERLTRAVAAWIAYVAERGGAVDDPMSGRFVEIARTHAPGGPDFAEAMVSIRAVFGELAEATDFRADVVRAVQSLSVSGGS